MTGRWQVLALLFSIRSVMAFQFATVGALGPSIGEQYHVDAADVGFLIGLYLSPGMVFALPGGVIGRLLGDKRAVLIGLVLMTVGGVISSAATTWEAQLVGRALAGFGGIILNVLMSKMVTDWFAGREIATAMALFVNSWPAGIALALLAQPFIAAEIDVSGAFAITSAFSALGFLALLIMYKQPVASELSTGAFPRGRNLVCIVVAGLIWGLFNASFAMVFAFSPILLTTRGWELAAASSATSLAVWISAISVPIGGIISDRSGRPNVVMVVGFLLTAVSLAALPRLDFVIPTLIAIGLFSGLPVGGMMSLPARVLAPEARALGMGVFFTFFYVCVVSAPMLAGVLIDTTGWDGAAMDMGAGMLVAAILCLVLFELVASQLSRAESG